MAMVAKDGCCEEAAIGMPGYFPCNMPATKVIGWKGRSDAPIRMCAACADHNTKNRGGYVVSAFPVPAASSGKGWKYKFTAEQIAVFERDLGKPHFEILMASLSDDYSAMSAKTGMAIGTIKSRLHRARTKLAGLIDKTKADLQAKDPTGVA